MRKRRIISLLLSATLIISSLSVTAFAQNSADVQTDSPQFVDGNGQAVTVVQPADTEPYIHVSGRDSGQDSVRYNDTVTTYSASKTYTISFKIRTPDYVESTDSTIASYPAYNRVLANAMWGGIPLDSGLKMTSDWVAKSYDVTNFNGTLYIFGDWHGNGVVPFDIKDFTIVEKGTTTNLAANPGALFADGAGWEVYNPAEANNMKEFTVSLATDSEYMTVPSIANVAAVKYDSDDVLSAGVYQISGDFRLPKIDYNLYTYDASVNLSSDGNAVPLTLTVGETTATPIGDVTITPDNWTNASFQLLLTENVSKSDIVFSLNTKYGLDFRNIEIEDQTENYDLTFLTADGQLVSPPQADEDTYIRFTGRDSADDVLLYKDTTRTYDESKTYTVSFKIRSREYIESTDAAIGEYPAYVRLIANSRWGTQIDGSIKLTSGWVQKTYDITGFNGELYFASHWMGLSMLPYDIKDLTITEKGTSENLAANADKIYRDGAGWEIYSNPGEGIKELGVYTMPRTDYLVVPSPTNPGDTTAFSFTNTDTLEPGVYHITGSFMLTDSVIDFNKYVFGTAGNLSADNNCKDLTVSVNGNALKTLDGEESVKVNSESFTNVTYRLTVSADDNISMSDILFTLSDSHDLCIKDISVTESSRLYTFGFVDGEGNPPMIVDGSQDELYLSVDGRAANADSLYYEMAGLDAGTYTASFKIRTKPYIADTDETVATFPASIRCNFNLNSGSQTTIASYYPISSAWESKGITFTVAEDNSSICLIFTGVWQGFGYAPFDIKDFAIVKSGSDENIAVNANGFLENGCGWSISESSSGATKELTLTRSTDIYYNRVALPESGNTELHFTGDDVLEPGTYEITGKFRLENDAPIDFSKYVSDGDSLSSDGNIISSEIYAYASGVKLSALTGNKVTVDSAGWRTVTFRLETIVPLNLNTVYFELDSAYVLNFTDVGVSLIERHLTMTPFGTNVIMVLFAVKQKQIEALGLNAPWGASNGTTVTTVDNVLDEATGLIGQKNGPAANNYIHMSGRDHNSDVLMYENQTTNLKPGTYTLTFFARTAEFENADANMISGRNPVSLVRLFITKGWDIITNHTVRKSGSFDPAQQNPNQLLLTSNWTKYSFTFTINEEKPFAFWFGGNSNGYSVAPIDIDGFTLVEVNPTSHKPITGENLAINSDKLLGTKAGWSVTDAGKANLLTEVKNISESEYMHATANSDGVITLASKGGTLAPGKYYITAKARIGTVDYLKYDFGGTDDSLAADNNKATVTASFEGNALKTVNGEDSAEITTEWTTVTFVVDVKKESTLKELKLSVQGANTVDFDYINVDTRINKTDKDSIVPSADGTVTLPALEVDMNGNLLIDAISEYNLPYWSYGNQKLELKEDENGEPYFSASNITSNTLGFTYKPGFSLKPGTYIFKAKVRTTNPGETDRIRIMVGELSTPAVIKNEWTEIYTEFSVTDEMEFTLKFRGGAAKTNIRDYEFKDISFVNVVSELLGQNLFANGDFNDKDAALEAWVYGRSSGLLTVNSEDGNSFLTASERENSNSAIDATLTGYSYAGVKYKISYDIRTTHESDTMQARTSVIAGGVNTDLNFNGSHFFDITHEWQHVEYTFTPTNAGDFTLRIAGGWRGEPDDKDYDIDNVKIEIIG